MKRKKNNTWQRRGKKYKGWQTTSCLYCMLYIVLETWGSCSREACIYTMVSVFTFTDK